jgi:hypothetical protein
MSLGYEEKYLKYKKKYFLLQEQIGGIDLKPFINGKINSIRNDDKKALALLLLDPNTTMSNNNLLENDRRFFIKSENNLDMLKHFLGKVGIAITIKSDDSKTVVLNREEYVKMFMWLFKDIMYDMQNVRIADTTRGAELKFDVTDSYNRYRSNTPIVSYRTAAPVVDISKYIPLSETELTPVISPVIVPIYRN